MSIGKIHPAKTLFFRTYVGTAKGDGERDYELCTAVASSNPIIESKKTGKWFTISWAEIVALAVREGIDER